jgi:hypothetical protein
MTFLAGFAAGVLLVSQLKGNPLMGAVQDAIDQVTSQLDKAKDEILTEIANLESQVAAGQAPDLTALKAAAQGLDDVVPDDVVPPDDTPQVNPLG